MCNKKSLRHTKVDLTLPLCDKQKAVFFVNSRTDFRRGNLITIKIKKGFEILSSFGNF